MRARNIKICLPEYLTYDLCLEFVSINPNMIKYVPDYFIDLNMCEKVVSMKHKCIRLIPNRFKNEAIANKLKNKNKWEFIKNISIEKLSHDIFIRFLEICDPMYYDNLLTYLPDNLKTDNFCLKTLTFGIENIKNFPKQLYSYEFCLHLVSEFKGILKLIPEKHQTPELCLVAAKKDKFAINYMRHDMRTLEIRNISYGVVGFN
jgi:hypothetical protein